MPSVALLLQSRPQHTRGVGVGVSQSHDGNWGCGVLPQASGLHRGQHPVAYQRWTALSSHPSSHCPLMAPPPPAPQFSQPLDTLVKQQPRATFPNTCCTSVKKRDRDVDLAGLQALSQWNASCPHAKQHGDGHSLKSCQQELLLLSSQSRNAPDAPGCRTPFIAYSPEPLPAQLWYVYAATPAKQHARTVRDTVEHTQIHTHATAATF